MVLVVAIIIVVLLIQIKVLRLILKKQEAIVREMVILDISYLLSQEYGNKIRKL